MVNISYPSARLQIECFSVEFGWQNAHTMSSSIMKLNSMNLRSTMWAFHHKNRYVVLYKIFAEKHIPSLVTNRRYMHSSMYRWILGFRPRCLYLCSYLIFDNQIFVLLIQDTLCWQWRQQWQYTLYTRAGTLLNWITLPHTMYFLKILI